VFFSLDKVISVVSLSTQSCRAATAWEIDENSK